MKRYKDYTIDYRYNENKIPKRSYNIDYAIESVNNGNNIIPFWKTHGSNIDEGCLCQWYKCKFYDPMDDIEYCCTEQFMMAQKANLFGDEESMIKIINETNPANIQKLGRLVKNFDPVKWDKFKYYIVVNGNIRKFEQNPKLKEYLLSTDDSILVEASPYDKIWGVGISEDNDDIWYPEYWKGQNLLGFALMEVRKMLGTRKEIEEIFKEMTGKSILEELKEIKYK